MNKIQNMEDMNLAQAYVQWHDDKSFAKASKDFNNGLQNITPIQKSTGAISNRFQNIDTNTSVRDGYSSWDYNWFRPGERTPVHFRDIIAGCMAGYEKVPVIKQVIDLSGDFVAQGIKLVHEDDTVQKFYDEWWKKVQGEERSERIANILYRCGNVIIKRADARLNPVTVQQWKAKAMPDLQHQEDVPISPNVIPYRYTILNPLIVEVLGENVAAFTGKVHYVLKLPTTFYNTLSIPLTSFNPSLLTEGMPLDIRQAVENNEKYLLLDSDKLICLFYKKDDWDVWAYPMLYSLLDEIIMLQKLKQADIAALDGVISHIRVWKLGSLEHKIFPTNAAISKLSNILLNHLAGGTMDLVWGPDLELTQTSTDIAKNLGSEKYEFVMNTIHSGLGIPAAIGRSKGTMSDNFMSIRVLLERLQYGRSVLTRFWEEEVRRVQIAMGFKTPPKITFENMVLYDEVAEKSLWLQLLDRNIVPVAAVQERFGRIPEIDNLMIMREQRAREAGKAPTKVSPYEDPEPQLSLTKIGMQSGVIAPSQLPEKFDLDLKKPSTDDQQIKDNMFPEPTQPAASSPTKKKKGVSGQGRPSGAKDNKKRKTRTPKPSSKASYTELITQAYLLQDIINQVINPFYLDKFNKKEINQLSKSEINELDRFKFNLLLNCTAEDAPHAQTIINDVLNRSLQVYDEIMDNSYKDLCKGFEERLNRTLTEDDLEMIKCYTYAKLKTSEVE